jgi:hypothetical protein
VWQLFSDVSGQNNGPIFNGQESEKKKIQHGEVDSKREGERRVVISKRGDSQYSRTGEMEGWIETALGV